MLLQELTVLFNLKIKQSKKRKNKGKKGKKENKKEKQKTKNKQKKKENKKENKPPKYMHFILPATLDSAIGSCLFRHLKHFW